MSTYTLPSTIPAQVFDLGFTRSTVPFRSPTTGDFQAADLLSEYWTITITVPPQMRTLAGALEAFFARVAGGVDLIQTHHLGRPLPAGTARGSMTLATSVSQFAKAFTFSGVGAGKTLLAGDMFGMTVGGKPQLFMVADNATANGSGVITVNTVNRIRATVASGATATVDRPYATFAVADQSVHFLHKVDSLDSFSVSLQESW